MKWEKMHPKQHKHYSNDRTMGPATGRTHFKLSDKRTVELTIRHSHLEGGYVQMLKDVPC
jgi:hypothetical protein